MKGLPRPGALPRRVVAGLVLVLVLVTAAVHGTEEPMQREEPMQCERVINPEGIDVEPLFDTFTAWARAVAASDLDALSELVTADAEFWTHGQPPLTGRDAVRGAFGGFFDAYDARQELIVGSHWALARGTEINSLTPKEGGSPVSVRQRAFSVLRRDEDGRWRFARGMTNSPPTDG